MQVVEDLPVGFPAEEGPVRVHAVAGEEGRAPGGDVPLDVG